MEKRLLYVSTVGLIMLCLFGIWIIAKGELIEEFRIEMPHQIAFDQDKAEVIGYIQCAKRVRMDDPQIMLYIRADHSGQDTHWWRSSLPCAAPMVAGQWHFPESCTNFPIQHSQFTIVAVLAENGEAWRFPSTLEAADYTTLRTRLLPLVYKECERAISPEWHVPRPSAVETPTPTNTPEPPTATPTEVPTATFTPIVTLIITPTATFTLTATLAITPTATFTPTATPTIIPTATFTPPSPTPTFTPTPYPPPELTGAEIIVCNVTLKWRWSGTLAEDEWFAVRVDIGEPHSKTWTKEHEYTHPLDRGGEYCWEIAICRGKPNDQKCSEQLAVSERRTFSFGGCAPAATPTKPLPPP